MHTLLYFVLATHFSAQAAAFQSPSGKREECRASLRIPGGEYSKGDIADENELCAIDFYAQTVALCPKTWSTSPGTMVYDTSKSNKSPREYESQASCGGNKDGHEKLARFKQSMNQQGTSATFSTSSLLYYHLARYFETTVNIPVAVYRTMDKDIHRERVSKRAHTLNMGKSGMNRVGWKWMYESEKDPSIYKPGGELFTADQQQIHGALLGGGGERYGAEINGIRSSWGVGQNNDFQNTPAFYALRSQRPLKEAIQEGLKLGLRDSKIANAMPGGASDLQMGIWMKELTEITLLDYIFNQQDRVGNIDFKWYVYSVMNDGKIERKKVDSHVSRASMSKINFEKPGVRNELVQLTQLVDNDAGGRAYANFTKKTQMLQKIRHINTGTYRRLMALSRDFQSRGTVYQFLSTQFGLSANQLLAIVNNTNEAAGIYLAACNAGNLRFDLATAKQLLREESPQQPANCSNP